MSDDVDQSGQEFRLSPDKSRIISRNGYAVYMASHPEYRHALRYETESLAATFYMEFAPTGSRLYTWLRSADFWDAPHNGIRITSEEKQLIGERMRAALAFKGHELICDPQ